MSYPEDHALREGVLRLYGAVWPALPSAIGRAAEFGSDWFSMSTPFVKWEGDQVVAHVGVAFTDLFFAGEACSIAAVHAVCVHPEFQGRGLGREMMNRALEWIDSGGHPTTILWSEKSEFYAKFGFARVQEPIFRGPAPSPDGARGRRLDLEVPADRGLLISTLRIRRPVSGVAAAADTGWHFLIDLALWPEASSMLYEIPSTDDAPGAIAVAERRGSVLHLYDVLGPQLPRLSRIVAAIGGDRAPASLDVYFTPDRLDAPLQPELDPLEDALHVRGAPLPGTRRADGGLVPFALSPLSRT